MKRLNLYTLDLKYVRSLSKVDDRVMSISPQAGKQHRPFVGIVLVCGSRSYCIPLSSPKPKHTRMRNALDFMRIVNRNEKLIGVLNLNNMIPVDSSVIRLVDMKCQPGDSADARRYKALLNDQLDWCNDNREAISRKANRLYDLVVRHPERSRSLVSRCCDFRKLELVLDRRKTAAKPDSRAAGC